MKHIIYFVYLIILSVALADSFAQEQGPVPVFGSGSDSYSITSIDTAHNCRFWGLIAKDSFNDSTMTLHLNTLKHLASTNPNGWGLGFYTETIRGGFIPVIYRGMWRADEDIMFDLKSRDMLDNLSGSAVAHVRRSSSGYVNIPDPHPFYTRSIERDFSMLFAHNGTLDKPTLIEMLGNYTDDNHYCYSEDGINDPNLDSDLYRLYLMKWIDEYPMKSISECLSDAIVELSTEMGTDLAYNFVMASNYDTLWALRYNFSLYYRREVSPEGYVWEVASQALSETGWIKASNHYLYAFTPGNASPDSTLVKESHGLPESIDNANSLNFEFPNPFSGRLLSIEIKVQKRTKASFQLYNQHGQSLSGTREAFLNPGNNQFSIDIGNLRAGIYFIKMEVGNSSQTKKLIVVEGS